MWKPSRLSTHSTGWKTVNTLNWIVIILIKSLKFNASDNIQYYDWSKYVSIAETRAL